MILHGLIALVLYLKNERTRISSVSLYYVISCDFHAPPFVNQRAANMGSWSPVPRVVDSGPVCGPATVLGFDVFRPGKPGTSMQLADQSVVMKLLVYKPLQ